MDAHRVVSDAVTRIAQKACRNGEQADRVWPPLEELPLLESWRVVGDRYAREILEEIGRTSLEIVPVKRLSGPPSMRGFDTIHLDCECSSLDHTLRIAVDQEAGDMWVHTQLTTFRPWYQRLWLAIQYVFRPGRGRYGHYDETCIRHEDFPRIREILAAAEKYRAESCSDTKSLV